MLAMVNGGWRNKNVSEFGIALWGVCLCQFYVTIVPNTVVSLCSSVLCVCPLC